MFPFGGGAAGGFPFGGAAAGGFPFAGCFTGGFNFSWILWIVIASLLFAGFTAFTSLRFTLPTIPGYR